MTSTRIGRIKQAVRKGKRKAAQRRVAEIGKEALKAAAVAAAQVVIFRILTKKRS